MVHAENWLSYRKICNKLLLMINIWMNAINLVKKNIVKKIFLDEKGIIKCPVIITPLFFTPALKMEMGGYF